MYRFILFTAGYEPLESMVRVIASEASFDQNNWSEDRVCLYDGRLFYFSGSIPYGWHFPKCAVVIHHGGSGTTAAAIQAGTPQVVCPFMLDLFYWAERMYWLGVSPEPLRRDHLLPDKNDDRSIQEAAHVLSMAIHDALSSRVKARAAEIAERIVLEEKFRQKKHELSSHNSIFIPGEDGADSQPSIDMSSELDIWVESVGKKNQMIFGLGSVNKILIQSSIQQTKISANSEEVDALRSQIHALNESLQRQEQEKLQMRQELTEIRKQVVALMQYLRFARSSSRPSSSTQVLNTTMKVMTMIVMKIVIIYRRILSRIFDM